MIHKICLSKIYPASCNAYLLTDNPLTLIDIGWKYSGTINALEQEIFKIGYKLTDIKKLILTHAHADHFGLAKILKEINNSLKIYAHKEDFEIFSNFYKHMEQEADFHKRKAPNFGFPEKIVKKFFDVC
jgi:glyoxylase-like metal-dependent hydrolase (beta-lactamase superfamily II)